MKKLLLLIGFGLSLTVSAQAPYLQWQKALGGTGDDQGSSIEQTTDGGYIVVGSTLSIDGDIVGNHGDFDIWIVKFNSDGSIQWQKALGGTRSDQAASIEETSDGGYILVGTTSSNDGDVSGNSFNTIKAWVVKLSNSGNVQWQQTYGVSEIYQTKTGTTIKQTADGGYIFTGEKLYYSPTGYLYSEGWIVKLNSIGGVQWEKTFGKQTGSIQQTSDGGYLVSGRTFSTYSDIWIVKLTNTGDIIWENTYGGTGSDGAGGVEQTIDGGYIIAGSTLSNDGVVTGNHGGSDAWVLKLTDTGAIEWEKTLGGTDDDGSNSIKQTTDGGYIVLGTTGSINGDVTSNNGVVDYWVVKLFNSGNIEWQKTIGGTGVDYASNIQQTSDGGYIVAGDTNSNDGDVTGNHGNYDYWIVKLSPDQLSTTEFSNTSLKLYPNPTYSLINIQTSNNVVLDKIIITDLMGKTVIEQTQNTNQVSVEKLASGVYILNGYSEGNKFQEKFIKE
jgi:hypothetical protein